MLPLFCVESSDELSKLYCTALIMTYGNCVVVTQLAMYRRVCPLKKPFSFKSAKNGKGIGWENQQQMADTIALSPLTALSRLCSVFVSASVNGNDKDDRQ